MSVHITDSSFTNASVYHGGRGGAGNYRKLSKAESDARNTLSGAPLPPSTASNNKVFFGGRGGAGNVHPSTERAMFSFDEELERDRLIHAHHAPVYSIGRGGKGNLVPSDGVATRSFYSPRSSEDSSPRSSASSTSSAGHGLSHLTQTFSAHSLKSGADKLWDRVRRS